MRYAKIYAVAEIDGKRLSDHELLMYLITLLIVGSETTPMVIAAFFYYLDRHPEQKAAVLADHSLIRQAFLEAARFQQPTNMLARRAAEDFEIGGCPIKKGQNLLFIYASADRDEEQFTEPDSFDIFRSDAEPNLTFGMGSHVCLGMHVGIEAAVVIIEEVLKDIADWQVIEDQVEPAYGEHLSGFVGMPVSFTLKAHGVMGFLNRPIRRSLAWRPNHPSIPVYHYPFISQGCAGACDLRESSMIRDVLS